MRFALEIDMGNAAFALADADRARDGAEVAYILRRIADSIDGTRLPPLSTVPMRDSNGNTVGSWRVKRAAPRKGGANA
jgi:hypothetical protein